MIPRNTIQSLGRYHAVGGISRIQIISTLNPRQSVVDQQCKRFASNRTKFGSEEGGKEISHNTTNFSPLSPLSIQNLHKLARNRKLTPAAKAKAQASAGRALREQLHATKVAGWENGGKNGSLKILANESNRTSKPSMLMNDTIDQQIPQSELIQEESDPSITFTPPTVRRIRDVYAYATAESYNFDVLIGSGRLPSQWQLIEDGNVIYIPHWPGRMPSVSDQSAVSFVPGVGEAFIFRSGSYVTWGISYEQSRKFLRSVIQGRPNTGGNAEVESYLEIGDEEMEYIIAEDQVTRVVGDVIVIGHQPRAQEVWEGNYVDDSAVHSDEPEEPDWSPMLARLAFSQGLSRSARLSVQEAALTKYLEEVADMPTRLEAEGKVPLPRRQVIRKMGTLLKLRQRANLDTENFLDDPEMYWENGELEHHYDSICQTLDIESRFKAYNAKLDHGENLLGVLRALLTESSTHRMELIIIYLIAFEVCLALISHEYIPSPERVRDWIMGIFTGESLQIHPDLATNTHQRISHHSNSQSSQNVSYWRWLLSQIPGFRQQSQTSIPSDHLV